IAESRKGKVEDEFADRKSRIEERRDERMEERMEECKEERREERRDTTSRDHDDMAVQDISTSRPNIVEVAPPEECKPSVRTVGPTVVEVKPPEPSKVQVDTFDEDFDPDYFRKRRQEREAEFARRTAAEITAEYNDPDQVFRELEERYSKEKEYVTPVEAFRPNDLQDSTSTTEHKVDNPNADVNIHVQRAGGLSGPPYEPAYAFTATKDCSSLFQPPWPIPTLNLIEPTPIHSVAGSVAGGSPPASPDVKPVDTTKVGG